MPRITSETVRQRGAAAPAAHSILRRRDFRVALAVAAAVHGAAASVAVYELRGHWRAGAGAAPRDEPCVIVAMVESTPPPAVPATPAAAFPAPEQARPAAGAAQAPPAADLAETVVPDAAPAASRPAPYEGIPSFSAGELEIRPRYPFGARMRGEEGRVRLLVNVLASGRADHVTVAETSGFPALDGAAIDAVKKARFHGVMPSSAGPGGEVLLQFRFQLVDAPPAGPSS